MKQGLPEIRNVSPHQVGWLRRPELDTDTQQVWEKPNGELFAHAKKDGRLVLEVLKRPKHG